ncbi:putrescine hydroxycinnamoyltransferase 1-like [Typha latifolia]|uniref:putrescine hydroxycinnamoyltransferase 1-like n=1 Tax=Typha latifolia TaxID=4733 RepID=UPI003C2ABA06
MAVEILESSLVLPREETPKNGLWVSNIDLVAARGYTPTIYVYRSHGGPGSFSPEVLKAALAKALVVFYPLAGRLGFDRTGRVEISCTGEGARFITARSDSYTVDDFKDFAPTAEMRQKFVPAVDSADPPCIMLMLQATSLKCGGVVLGFAIHHLAFDGRGAALFIQTFSAIARGDSAAIATLPLPFLDRTILRARSPPSVLFDHRDCSSKVFQSGSPSPCVTANLKLSKDYLSILKRCCGAARVSTFRAIVAHIWRCTCIARGLASDAETQLFLPVDVRSRVKPPLPLNYMGNAGFRTKAVAKVGELVSNTLGFGAERVQTAIERVNDGYVKSFVDYLESVDLESLSKRGGMPNTSLCAISWLGMPMYDADFGWGEPEVMSRAQMYGSGFVYIMGGTDKDGEISVVIGLETDSMQRFKKIFYEEPSVVVA